MAKCYYDRGTERKAFDARNVAGELMGSAEQVTAESRASGIAALEPVSADDILGVDRDLQPAFALDRKDSFGGCAAGHYAFATH